MVGPVPGGVRTHFNNHRVESWREYHGSNQATKDGYGRKENREHGRVICECKQESLEKAWNHSNFVEPILISLFWASALRSLGQRPGVFGDEWISDVSGELPPYHVFPFSGIL